MYLLSAYAWNLLGFSSTMFIIMNISEQCPVYDNRKARDLRTRTDWSRTKRYGPWTESDQDQTTDGPWIPVKGNNRFDYKWNIWCFCWSFSHFQIGLWLYRIGDCYATSMGLLQTGQGSVDCQSKLKVEHSREKTPIWKQCWSFMLVFQVC